MATTDSVERTAQALLRRVRTRRRMSARAWRRAVAFYLFIAPWLLGFVFLLVFPLIVGFLTSLTNYDGLNLDSVKFVGLSNYGRVFEDADAVFSSERTVLWSALNTPIYICLSFVLALILNQHVKGRGFFRTIFFLPYVIPPWRRYGSGGYSWTGTMASSMASSACFDRARRFSGCRYTVCHP